MNNYYITLLAIFLPIIFILFLYFYYLIPIKMRIKKLSKFADEYSEKIRQEGLDKYYESLETAELLNLYNEFMENFKNNKKDLIQMAENGCKSSFIEDILKKRNVNIPE